MITNKAAMRLAMLAGDVSSAAITYGQKTMAHGGTSLEAGQAWDRLMALQNEFAQALVAQIGDEK